LYRCHTEGGSRQKLLDYQHRAVGAERGVCTLGDALGKLIKFLDQLLPFLATAPAWLRGWVYVLVVLNFATIAAVSISYIVSKEQNLQDESLRRFTIDRPTGNEEIPLGASRSWMIEGKFPIPGDKESVPTLALEVLKLPDRDPAPQEGKARLDTVTGFWRFESAKFPSDGSYEIVATIARGNQTFPRMVQINCTQKAEAYRKIIDKGRRARGAATLSTEAQQHLSLPALKSKLAALDSKFWTQYGNGSDLAGALKTATNALDLLDPVLPQSPDDFELQNFRAYFLKDYGMVQRDLNHPQEAQTAFREAGKMFEAVRQQKPDDPSAWNGLGSVAALSGDYNTALHYINKALQIQPDYSAAIEDRKNILNLMQQQKTQHR